MSMYEQFKTSDNLEVKGIHLDYGGFRVTIARAGGANKRFAKIADAKSKPYRRAIQTETLDADVSMRLLREVYAEAVVVNWEVKQEDKWVQGIEGPDGKVLPFNRGNILKTFEALPDLFMDIQSQATKVGLYRETMLEEDSKN